MERFGRFVVRFRAAIFAIGIFLLIPSAIGYFNTKVNYDILYYLPQEIETMQGQNILLDEFGTGAFSLCVVEGMENKDIVTMKEKMEQIPHVKKIIWYDTVASLSMPMQVLPEEIETFFNNHDKDATMMAILFDTGTSEDETMTAIEQMRKVAGEQCFISGMSAVVTDTKNLANQETPIYVIIAVILAIIVLSLTMNSGLAPVFFLISIGMAIIYNLGSNIIQGEISYITQALAAVLQLGVTMDYSIFLWHSYESYRKQGNNDEDAMAHAIAATITSVVGSSITTVAGFIALCFMSFTLGMDLGVTMAKGVVLGVISCITILPSMLLIFRKVIDKTRHKVIIPELGKISEFVIKHSRMFLILFVVILPIALYGYSHTDVYYDLVGTLPKNLQSVQANEKLDEDFGLNATHMILVDSSLSQKTIADMVDEMEAVDGVKAVLGIDSLLGASVPRELIPDEFREELMNDNCQVMIISSEYAVASEEVNAQCDELNLILKQYDENGKLIGEAPCTKDLITITDEDFKIVSAISIVAIFLIIAVVFRSILLPIILVSVIEFAIFINMGIPFYTHTQLPFIASIVIGTIQLGATVDYAILMTNKYKVARIEGMNKKEAVTLALQGSVQSVFVSALSFFAATFGVGVYSKIDMISALCLLMARGAIVSMIVVLTVLPSALLLFDGLIIRTTMNMKKCVKAKQA
ncbi:MAG: RND family transporter [Lachnospiraceae bacterium]